MYLRFIYKCLFEGLVVFWNENIIYKDVSNGVFYREVERERGIKWIEEFLGFKKF